jgi:hypothetical protein
MHAVRTGPAVQWKETAVAAAVDADVATSMINSDHLRQWVGRERSAEDDLSPFPARALAAAFDHSDPPEVGSALPPA